MEEYENLENYIKIKRTVDIVRANIIGILILVPIIVIYGGLFYLVNDFNLEFADFKNSLKNIESDYGMLVISALVFFTIILGIVIHEIIHGITWSFFAKKGFKSIKFGVLWELLTPYCHCKEPLLVRHYILGAIMPAIVLGFIPALYSIATGNIFLLLFGILFTQVAIGDFLVIKLIRKEKSNNLVQDHPSEPGCYIYRSE